MSSLTQSVSKIADNLDLMRHVSVTIFHSAAAQKNIEAETGVPYSSVISPNCITLPEIADEIDPASLETMRGVWIDAINYAANSDSVPKDELSHEDHFETVMLSRSHHPDKDSLTAEETFVRAAKHPIPSQYQITLPQPPSNMRGEIMASLIPFKETREMLARLEQKLDLPMRAVMIRSARVCNVTALRASMH